eukprot:gene2428-5368_t
MDTKRSQTKTEISGCMGWDDAPSTEKACTGKRHLHHMVPDNHMKEILNHTYQTDFETEQEERARLRKDAKNAVHVMYACDIHTKLYFLPSCTPATNIVRNRDEATTNDDKGLLKDDETPPGPIC